MTGVEREQDLPTEGIGQIELHRTDDITLRANAKELRLHRVQVVARVDCFREDGVQRAAQPLARRAAVGGAVLVAIGNPDVGHGRRSQFLPEVFADLAAGDAVLDPKLANACIGMGKRKPICRFWM